MKTNQFPPLSESDRFPLWSFGYKDSPSHDDPRKVVTSRGRTHQEAWVCVQHYARSFLEPNRVGLLAAMPINEGYEYSKTHRYDWIKMPPLWLKLLYGREDLTIEESQLV